MQKIKVSFFRLDFLSKFRMNSGTLVYVPLLCHVILELLMMRLHKNSIKQYTNPTRQSTIMISARSET